MGSLLFHSSRTGRDAASLPSLRADDPYARKRRGQPIAVACHSVQWTVPAERPRGDGRGDPIRDRLVGTIWATRRSGTGPVARRHLSEATPYRPVAITRGAIFIQSSCEYRDVRFTLLPRPSHVFRLYEGAATTAIAAASGLLAAAAATSVGHLVAVVVAPAASPLLAVGSTLIDLTPEWLKSFAIRTFGQNDKIVLLWGILAVLTVAALGVGLVAGRRPRLAVGAIGAFGGLGAIAALARPGGSLVSIVPALVGVLVGIAVLIAMARRAFGHADKAANGEAINYTRGSVSRRGFVISGAAVGLLIAVSGGLGVIVAGRRSSSAADAGLPIIPAPLEPAGVIPAGADFGIDGVSSVPHTERRFLSR